MRKFILAAAAALAAVLGSWTVSAWMPQPMMISGGSGAQVIASVSLSNTSFTPDTSATIGGIIVTMKPSSPPFAGVLSITDNGNGLANDFTLTGTCSGAGANNGCSLATNGIQCPGTPPCSYPINIVASQFGSPNICLSSDLPADVAAAGFNTCARYDDFTTPIPNTVGTGLPSNWLDCSFSGATGANWYFGAWDRNSSPGVPPCSSVSQATDTNGGGNLALNLKVPYSATSAQNNGIYLGSINFAATGGTHYPNAYFETVFRCSPSCGNGLTNGISQGWWSWVNGTGATNPPGLLEIDFIDNAFGTQGRTEWNNWSSVACGAGLNDCDPRTLFTSTADVTQYHKWGQLFTGNGSGGFSVCTYFDGVRQNCTTSSYESDASPNGRRYLRVEAQVLVANPPMSPSWVGGFNNGYFKYFKVISCANWQVTTSSGMCNGTTLNGTGFYQ